MLDRLKTRAVIIILIVAIVSVAYLIGLFTDESNIEEPEVAESSTQVARENFESKDVHSDNVNEELGKIDNGNVFSTEILKCEDSPNHSSPQEELNLESLSKKFELIDAEMSDFLIAYHLLTKEERIAFSLFEGLIQSDRFSDAASYNLLKICSSAKLSGCTNELIEKLLSKTSHNATSWLMAASFYAEKSNIESLEYAFGRALSAPENQETFIHEVKLISEAIRTTEDMSEKDIGMNLLGLQAAETLPGIGYINYCVQNASVAEPLFQTCEAITELMIKKGTSDMQVLLAYNMAEKLKEKSGDFEAAELLREKKESYSKYWNEPDFLGAFNLAMNDESLWGFWLNSMLNSTQKEARESFINEAKRRSLDPSYNPCRGKSE